MPTDAQIEANRRNAQRSTGPKTEEGKKQSRRNALKHGLAAEVLVPDEDRKAFRKEKRRMREEIEPRSRIEEVLVRRAARSSMRLSKCEQIEDRTLEQTVLDALNDWEERRRHAIRSKAQALQDEPAELVEALEGSAFGCDWMIRHWKRLERALLGGKRAWSRDQLDQALRLLGRIPAFEGDEGDPETRRLARLAAVIAPDAFTPPTPTEADPPITDNADAARAELLELVRAERERLDPLRALAWDEVEGPEQQAVIERARIDTTAQGQANLRYERSAELGFHRSLERLMKIRAHQNREDYKAIRQLRPKTSMGAGWWKEEGAAPSPPGFVPAPASSLGFITTAAELARKDALRAMGRLDPIEPATNVSLKSPAGSHGPADRAEDASCEPSHTSATVNEPAPPAVSEADSQSASPPSGSAPEPAAMSDTSPSQEEASASGHALGREAADAGVAGDDRRNEPNPAGAGRSVEDRNSQSERNLENMAPAPGAASSRRMEAESPGSRPLGEGSTGPPPSSPPAS